MLAPILNEALALFSFEVTVQQADEEKTISARR
jgi:hypothetical protein